MKAVSKPLVLRPKPKLVKPNLVLIGMPGAGKSTVGRWLARQLGYTFIDGDVLIEHVAGMSIQHVVDRMGLRKFSQIEENVLRGLSETNAVISTGGSAVYSEEAMRDLGENGLIIYLKISVRSLVHRVDDATSRGLHKMPAHSLPRVYQERIHLYPKYADITFENDAPFTAVKGAELMQKLQRFTA